MPTLDRDDSVFVLDLGSDENRLHPDWVASVNAALDEVEKAEGPRALVTTATGKFYSNGLDLEWAAQHMDEFEPYIVSVQHLYARLLTLPMITVAAIQGHAFAAGAMLTARRYGGTDAASVGIVDQAVAEDAVRAEALQIAQTHVSKAGDTVGTTKARMYAATLALLRDTDAPLS
jgi:enoyl-CoA hydratase/carnithine racemase